MDKVIAECPLCHAKGKIPKEIIGKTIKCPKCNMMCILVVTDNDHNTNNTKLTKSCPFCAEDILAEAIICKHCKSSLTTNTPTTINHDKKEPQIDERTTAFIMGLIGGIIGIISGIVAMTVAGIGMAFGAKQGLITVSLGVTAILFSIWGIIGSVIVRNNGKLGGMFLTAATLGGFITISFFYLIPGVLMGIPGIMNLVKKNQNGVNPKYLLWIPVTVLTFWFLLAIGFSTKEKSVSKPRNIKPPIVLNVNKSVTNDDVIVTANNVIQGYNSSNRFDKPDNTNNEFVVVYVTIKNSSLKPVHISSLNFTLEDDAGVKRYQTSIAGMNNKFEFVTLQPQGKIIGNIAFEAQKNSSKLILHYSERMNSDNDKLIILK